MRLGVTAILGLGLLGYACGGDDGATVTTAGTGGSATGTGGTGGTGGMGGCSPQPGVEPGPDWICVTDVEGQMIDESGSGVPDILMTVCGPGGCEPDTTDASGTFNIEVGFPLFPPDWSLIPDSREAGKFVFYYPFVTGVEGPLIEMGSLRLIDYPAPSDMLVAKSDDMGAPAQTVTNGDVTLDIPAGVRVNLDVEDVLLGDDGKNFYARKVDGAVQDEFVDPAIGAVALYALAPFDAAFDLESDPGTLTKVPLTFANTTSLPADAAVQFYQQGSFVVGQLATGVFHPVATGAVSSDGTTITMDAGEGIEFLTWVAIVEAP